jgi:ABC-2 type transport system permease protein
MSLRSLLRKEVYWGRRNLLVLLLVLCVVPGFFAASSLLFQDVIPRDTPVAVVAGSDDVTQRELLAVQAGLSFFATPVAYDHRNRSLRDLQRERVYAVVEVPHGIRDAGRDVTFRLFVDGSMVPFKEPSQTIAAIMESRLDRELDARVSVERVVVGNSHDLSGYLVPIVLLGLVMLLAFTYVPHTLASERRALDRIRLESSLEAVVGAKLLFFTVLMLVPLVVFHVVLDSLQFDIAVLTPATVLAVLLSFVALSAVALAVVVATRFTSTGRFVNAVFLLFVLGFSGLAYPAGYFSALRRTVVRAMPTHYATVLVRSSMLRDLPLSAVADWLVGLASVAVAALVVLELSIVYYRRSV